VFVDYIRTFTWDKKLEMVVKSTYNQIGGQGQCVTVNFPHKAGQGLIC
jgi:1-phosphatidylinositol-3-phosphate 5-kinase